MIVVSRRNKPEVERVQCCYPKELLKDVGYKGYREIRAHMSRKTVYTCMRDATWLVDGKPFCTQHAGIIALEFLESVQGLGHMLHGDG